MLTDSPDGAMPLSSLCLSGSRASLTEPASWQEFDSAWDRQPATLRQSETLVSHTNIYTSNILCSDWRS